GELAIAGKPAREDFYPPVLSLQEWHRARMALVARTNGRTAAGRPSPQVRNLFTGVAFDASDGEVLRIQEFINGKGKARRLSLLSAGVINRRNTGNPSMPIPYGTFENAFLRFVRELKVGDVMGNGRDRDEEQLLVLDGEKADLEGKIARY